MSDEALMTAVQHHRASRVEEAERLYHQALQTDPRALSALSHRRDQQLDNDMANSIADPADDVETMIEAQDRSAIIQKCLSQLSSEHREVIDLIY